MKPTVLGWKPYKCDRCGRDYKHKTSLSKHKSFECGKEPRFSCKYVGCIFKTKFKASLKGHLRKHDIPEDEMYLYL